MVQTGLRGQRSQGHGCVARINPVGAHGTRQDHRLASECREQNLRVWAQRVAHARRVLPRPEHRPEPRDAHIEFVEVGQAQGGLLRREFGDAVQGGGRRARRGLVVGLAERRRHAIDGNRTQHQHAFDGMAPALRRDGAALQQVDGAGDVDVDDRQRVACFAGGVGRDGRGVDDAVGAGVTQRRVDVIR